MSFFKKLVFGLAGVMSGPTPKAQPSDLKQYATEQTALQRKGMYMLAGWAGANLITGAYFSSKTDGSAKYFHRMNLYWNGVNGALAGIALLRLSKKTADESLAAIYKKQQSVEKVFLLNAGLDVAYLAGGLYLNEKSKNDLAKSSQWKGYGNSVVLQGGFLLLFDSIMYGLMHHKGTQLENVLEKVQLGSNGNNVSLTIRW